MNHDDELDVLLGVGTHDGDPEGDMFVAAVMTGIVRQRHRRRVTLWAVGCVTTALVSAAWMLLPLPALAPAPERLSSIVAGLGLATLCGWIWIESGSAAPR